MRANIPRLRMKPLRCDFPRLTRRTIVGGAIVAIAAAHTIGCRQTPAFPLSVPVALDDGWTIGSPEQAGIDRRCLEEMTGSIRANPAFNVHAVLIEHDGRLVYEEYFSGTDERRGRSLGVVAFTREMKHDIRSVTKSVISALVDIAAGSGAIRSLDAPLLDFFPEYADLQVPERRQITIRHALTMSAGFDWNEDVSYRDPKNDETAMEWSADPLRYVLSRPIVARRQERRGATTAERPSCSARSCSARPGSRSPTMRGRCCLSRWASATSSGWGASRVCHRPLRDCVCGRAISRNSVRSTCTAASGTDTRWCRAVGLTSRPGGG